MSTLEAEYVAFSFATQEVILLRKLLTDLRITLPGPIVLMEDNQGANAITKTMLDMPEPSIFMFAINMFVKLCKMLLLTYVLYLFYCPLEEIIASRPVNKTIVYAMYVKLWEWSSYQANNLSIKWE